MKTKPEELLHLKVCDFLRKNYPDVIFRTDFSSGMKMSIGQASKHKKFQSSRAYPDLFIAYPQFDGFEMKEAGLFLELKAEGTKLYKKDGSLRKNQHIEEQAEILERLRKAGYCAEFAVGYAEAISKIGEYLGEPRKGGVEF